MYGYAWSWPMSLWMGVGALLWLAAIVLIIWLVARWLERRGVAQRDQSSGEPNSLEILRQRYARGELDAASYEQMRERLGG